MSFYLRPISNKFTSFVNLRKQVTDINYQLSKNVKSSLFLDEVSTNCFTMIISLNNYLYMIFLILSSNLKVFVSRIPIIL